MITVFALIVLFVSIIIHEIAHGSIALSLGDSTARDMGRLTLNPLKHIDPVGTILLPLMLMTLGSSRLIGWAKPVPINPLNFRDQKWGELKVSLAGPATNFLIAAFFAIILRIIPMTQTLFDLFSIIIFYNLLLAVFNLVPIPPLDGSHILFSLLPASFSGFKRFLSQYGFFILIFFIFYGIQIIFFLVQFLYNLLVFA